MKSGVSGRAGLWAVAPAVLWTLCFFVLPFIGMLLISLAVKQVPGWSLGNYTQFFTNPSYWRALTNSIEVTAMVTMISVVLAYPFAWILAFVVPERWQRLALLLAVLPFWTSYVVRSYSWLLVLAEKGVVNSLELHRRGHDVSWFGPESAFAHFKSLESVAFSKSDRFVVVPFNTGTSAHRLHWAQTEAMAWYRALPSLDAFDLVISDNLVEILNVRPDAIISGHFLWSHAFANLPPEFVANEASLLRRHQPPILAGRPFISPQLRSYPQLVEIGLCGSDGQHAVQRSNGSALLVSAGRGGGISGPLENFLNVLAARKPETFDVVYVEPHVLRAIDAPPWLKPADYSVAMYSTLGAAICRPGIGTVTDCLQHDVRIFALSEPDNLEVTHNGNVLEALGLGESCVSFADAYEQAVRYASDEAARERNRLAITKHVSFSGQRDAADYCEKRLSGA